MFNAKLHNWMTGDAESTKREPWLNISGVTERQLSPQFERALYIVCDPSVVDVGNKRAVSMVAITLGPVCQFPSSVRNRSRIGAVSFPTLAGTLTCQQAHKICFYDNTQQWLPLFVAFWVIRCVRRSPKDHEQWRKMPIYKHRRSYTYHINGVLWAGMSMRSRKVCVKIVREMEDFNWS